MRPRPLQEAEDPHLCISIADDGRTLDCVSANGDAHRFTFDHVFPLDASQAEVYALVGRPLVEHIMQGECQAGVRML